MNLLSKALVATAVAFAPLALGGIAAVHAATPKTIVVGLDNESFPPFYSKAPDGQWQGWEIDLIHAVCHQMGAQCTYKPIAFDGLIPALQQKQIDLIWASLTINGARQKVIGFTHAYYNSPIVLIGDKSVKTNASCSNLSSYKGDVIGAQAGSNYADFLQQNIPAGSGVQLKTYDTVSNMLADLNAGRIDYAMEAKATLSPFLKQHSDFGVNSTCPGNPILGYGIGGGVRQSDNDLRAALNKAIAALEKNGTWDKITAKYPGLKDEIVMPK